jgi:phage tail sheath protein FI
LRSRSGEARCGPCSSPTTATCGERVKRNINAFFIGLWRQGAVAGNRPEEAFFVVCDESNNPQSSRDDGLLIVDVGVAPVKPAEFVVFQISQWQGGSTATE